MSNCSLGDGDYTLTFTDDPNRPKITISSQAQVGSIQSSTTRTVHWLIWQPDHSSDYWEADTYLKEDDLNGIQDDKNEMWITLLKNEPKLLFKAASLANEAYKYLLSFGKDDFWDDYEEYFECRKSSDSENSNKSNSNDYNSDSKYNNRNKQGNKKECYKSANAHEHSDNNLHYAYDSENRNYKTF